MQYLKFKKRNRMRHCQAETLSAHSMPNIWTQTLSFSPSKTPPHADFTSEKQKQFSYSHITQSGEIFFFSKKKQKTKKSKKASQCSNSKDPRVSKSVRKRKRGPQPVNMLLTEASELKSKLKLCSEQQLSSLHLLLNSSLSLKGVDWSQDCDCGKKKSPHHSHKVLPLDKTTPRRGGEDSEKETLKYFPK